MIYYEHIFLSHSMVLPALGDCFFLTNSSPLPPPILSKRKAGAQLHNFWLVSHKKFPGNLSSPFHLTSQAGFCSFSQPLAMKVQLKTSLLTAFMYSQLLILHLAPVNAPPIFSFICQKNERA